MKAKRIHKFVEVVYYFLLQVCIASAVTGEVDQQHAHETQLHFRKFFFEIA